MENGKKNDMNLLKMKLLEPLRHNVRAIKEEGFWFDGSWKNTLLR